MCFQVDATGKLSLLFHATTAQRAGSHFVPPFLGTCPFRGSHGERLSLTVGLFGGMI